MTNGLRSLHSRIEWPPGVGRGGALALLEALWEAPIPMAVLDRQLRLALVNAAFSATTGHPPDAHVGVPAELIAPFVAGPHARAALEEGRSAAAVPVSAEWPPGSRETRYWTASYHPLRADSDDVLAVAVVLVDTTLHRRAERTAGEARSEAEDAVQALIRLQTVTASLAAALTPAEVARVVMEQGVGLLDAAAGSLSWTTDLGEMEILDSFGYPQECLVARRRHPVDLPEPLAETLRTGKPVWLESAREFATRYPHLASAVRPFSGASVAVPLVARERVAGVLGIDFEAPRSFEPADASFVLALAHQTAQALERARMYDEQERLRRRAERTAALLDTLFSSVPIGLAFVDRDLRFVHVNGAWARLHGASPDEFVGRALAEAFGGDGGAERVRGFARVLQTGEPVLDSDVTFLDPAEGVRSWLESCYPVVAGADTIGLGFVSRDVTDARRAEEFHRNVLGIVGHDLRNPLNAISGFTRLLAARGGLDDDRVRMLGRIEASAAKAARIARDLLDLTRIQSACGIPIERKGVRVDELCAAVVEEAGTAFPGREVRSFGRGDVAVRWDPDRVSQALSNLVVNAFKYGAQDRPVTVEWDDLGVDVAVRVRNWGAPIPPDVGSHLFEPFRQGEQAGAKAGGLGLGLYIAREVARAHGGSLEACSSEDEGTVFTLRLPRYEPA